MLSCDPGSSTWFDGRCFRTFRGRALYNYGLSWCLGAAKFASIHSVDVSSPFRIFLPECFLHNFENINAEKQLANF